MAECALPHLMRSQVDMRPSGRTALDPEADEHAERKSLLRRKQREKVHGRLAVSWRIEQPQLSVADCCVWLQSTTCQRSIEHFCGDYLFLGVPLDLAAHFTTVTASRELHDVR